MGRFGQLAFQRLSGTMNDTGFVLVDPKPVHPETLKDTAVEIETVPADGIRFLVDTLHPSSAPDWIIPALPVHLAAEWCLHRLGPDRAARIPVPAEADTVLPNPMRGDNGDLYVSHATFLCPDDCAEPQDKCTATGNPRKQNMFSVLTDTRLRAFRSLVVRSRQLGPGVGGFRPGQLFDLLDQLSSSPGNTLVATACRCHGVVTAMRVSAGAVRD